MKDTIILVVSAGSVLGFASGRIESESMEEPVAMMTEAQSEIMPGPEGLEAAIFAGGCL